MKNCIITVTGAKFYTIIIITNIDLMFETKHPQIIIVSKFKSQGLKMLK